MPAVNDPDVLRDTDDDGCPWCPYEHPALVECPEGPWSDEDGQPLGEDPELIRLAFKVADVDPGAPPTRRRMMWLALVALAYIVVPLLSLVGALLGALAIRDVFP